MIQINAQEEYLRAMHLGQKEKKKLEAAGKNPYPDALDELYPGISHGNAHELPVQEIPVDRIVGTATIGRMNVFSASFLPLPEPESEFAQKWMALCRAHLSDTGIRDPIECFEYLGNFYVIEGNKRTGVLRYFGAVRIPARIRRILPTDKSDPRVIAYYEFLDFHRATGLYDVIFRNPGDFARLYAALGKKPGEKWNEDEVSRFSSCYYHFKTAFLQIGGEKRDLQPEDALLMFFRVYTYDQLALMSSHELKKALTALWGDVQASAEPDAITVKTLPEDEDKLGTLGKLILGVPRHLNVAFIYRRDEESSPWTRAHAQGAAYLREALGDAVNVREYPRADTPEETEALLDAAAHEGAEVVFTTTPPLLHATLRAALRYPKIRFYNCSACKPLSSVRSYYCRTYEGKFITGLIAGALADNDLVGYIGSYPISGVPASINAFALGVRMTNPRAKVLLEWSCLPGDPVSALREKGVRVISNRDIPLPDPRFMEGGNYGAFLFDGDGRAQPIASPCWIWGRLYERIVRSILGGTGEKKDQAEAVNYWWGMDSGVIDVAISDAVPAGVRHLAQCFAERLRDGTYDLFSQRMVSSDGTVICDGVRKPAALEILQMDRLSDAVSGRIPEYEELLPMSRELVRELLLPGMKIPPETEERT